MELSRLCGETERRGENMMLFVIAIVGMFLLWLTDPGRENNPF